MNSNKCRLCRSNLFQNPILTLDGMPKAAQYYPAPDEFEGDKGMVLNIYQCEDCGLVQLNIDPVDYFKEVITAASFSEKTRLFRLNQMEKFVKDHNLYGKRVLDIGTGKGDMLDVLEEAGMKALGVEASAEFIKIGTAAGRKMVNGYIGDIHQIDGQPFDAFISLNYLEHLPWPGDIIKRIYELTGPDAVGFVTVPNLEYLLRTKCFYEFVADHLSYFTEKTLRFAFESNGFDVVETYTINDDNDVVAVVKKRLLLDISDEFSEVAKLIKSLQKLVGDYKAQHKKVAVWGAGHRTLALLALSQLNDIEYIVDSAKFKQGKFSPVLHLDIVSPEHLKKEPVDLVIVMVPGIYPSEVLKTLKGMGLKVNTAILKDNAIELM